MSSQSPNDSQASPNISARERSAALDAEIQSLLPWVIPDNDPSKAYVEWPPGSEERQARVSELSAQKFSLRLTDEEWAEIKRSYDELMGDDDGPSAQEYRHPPQVEAAFARREEMIHHLNLPGAPKNLHWGPDYVPNEWDTMNHEAAVEASTQAALEAFFPDLYPPASASTSTGSAQPDAKVSSNVEAIKPVDNSKPSPSES
ncbi:uncharacterized protein LOC62_06G008412 [Vanrija pseudolonga]|uniref:Uncharacterized protein n=1 Tax=Vanrija pseudolonga TaxID=143232 RepID=A0AAF0YI70_9TREE|nr:hypothetical protein LOC62_06G008412 [Vanrija pseudolonga]